MGTSKALICSISKRIPYLTNRAVVRVVYRGKPRFDIIYKTLDAYICSRSLAVICVSTFPPTCPHQPGILFNTLAAFTHLFISTSLTLMTCSIKVSIKNYSTSNNPADFLLNDASLLPLLHNACSLSFAGSHHLVKAIWGWARTGTSTTSACEWISALLMGFVLFCTWR